MTIIYFIILIGVLIFVHEMGHFLFAKLFNFKVLRFALGFGPRAFGFRRGETEYCVCWVPLGGYVKMVGEDPQEEIAPEDRGRAFHQKPLWQRFLVVIAGPIFNLLFPLGLYLVFFAGQTHLAPAVIGKVFAGQPAAAAGLQSGDIIKEINGHTVRYWEDLQDFISNHPNQSLRFLIERDQDKFERLITPQEQISPNRLNIRERVGRIGISPRFDLAQIGISHPESPAARAGLRTGDLITSINGVSIERWEQLDRALKQNRGQSLRLSYLRPSASTSTFSDLRLLQPNVTVVDPEALTDDKGHTTYETGIFSAEFFVREVEKDSPAEKMGMRPGDRLTMFDGQPLHHWDLMILALELKRDEQHQISWVPYGGVMRSAEFRLNRINYVDEYRQDQQRYVFGAQNRLLWKSAPPIPIEGRAFYAVTQSVTKTGEIIGLMAVAFVQLFRGAIPRDTIGGPVMLYYTAGVAAEKGWDHFLWMMALISINLGLLNLLPVPMLDGGHLMFFTIEALRRKPLDLRTRQIAMSFGLAMLVALMVLAFKNDIVRYWFRS